MCSDLPSISPRIPDHGAPIPVWHVPWFFNQLGTMLDRSTEDSIRICHVDIQERGHWIAINCRTNHQHRIVDSKLGRTFRSEVACGAKHMFDESDECFRIIN